jgi:hypothetical protein
VQKIQSTSTSPSPINAPGPRPIDPRPTYIIITRQAAAAKNSTIKGFLKCICGPGQVTAPTIDYAPLSKSLRTQAKAQLSKIVIPAS